MHLSSRTVLEMGITFWYMMKRVHGAKSLEPLIHANLWATHLSKRRTFSDKFWSSVYSGGRKRQVSLLRRWLLICCWEGVDVYRRSNCWRQWSIVWTHKSATQWSTVDWLFHIWRYVDASVDIINSHINVVDNNSHVRHAGTTPCHVRTRCFRTLCSWRQGRGSWGPDPPASTCGICGNRADRVILSGWWEVPRPPWPLNFWTP